MSLVKNFAVAVICAGAFVSAPVMGLGKHSDHPKPPKARVMSEEMQEALNKQLKSELESAYMYFGMATYFEESNLPGFSHWFRVQANEEMQHFHRVYQFMIDRGVSIELPALSAPSTDYPSIVETFYSAMEHEQGLTNQINDLYGKALSLREYDASSFAMWFLQEQVEEENLFSSLIDQLERIGGCDANQTAILWLDRELGTRAEAMDNNAQ